ncbi:hypothetical protein MBANPS3_010240 [Mucor bainieri]
MQLLTIDFPAGLDGFGPEKCPKIENDIRSLPRVLQLVLNGRNLMEAMKTKIEAHYEPEALTRLSYVPPEIIPAFIHVHASSEKKQTKKRKFSIQQ